MFDDEFVWFTSDMTELKGQSAQKYLAEEYERSRSVYDSVFRQLENISSTKLTLSQNASAASVMELGEELSLLKIQLELILDELKEY